MTYCYLLNIKHLTFQTLNDIFRKQIPDACFDKASQYRMEYDRVRTLSGEILARWALQKHFGISPDEPFLQSENGKPHTLRPDVYFNISHSGEWVTAAVADSEIGVDVEKLRTNKMGLAQRFFSTAEINHINTSANPDNAFTRLWTIKEAYLKYLGKGLTKALNSFTVLTDKETIALADDTKRILPVHILTQELPDKAWLAICAHQPIKTTSVIKTAINNIKFKQK